MIVMFVRQELMQQNLTSDQQWQLPWVHPYIQQQARQHFQEHQAGQLPEGGHQDGGHWGEDGQVRGSPYGIGVKKSRRMGGASISKDSDFAQQSSFRDMNEQKRSVLGGGGGIIGSVQSRLHLQANLAPDIVCSGISVRFRTWSDIAATS